VYLGVKWSTNFPEGYLDGDKIDSFGDLTGLGGDSGTTLLLQTGETVCGGLRIQSHVT